MLNRNDRKALRRSRSTVSWLSFIITILILIIANMYHNSNSLHHEISTNIIEINEYSNEIIQKNRKIDSLSKELNLLRKDTVKINVEPKKYVKVKTKVDSTITVSKSEPDTSNKIPKDSLK